MSASRSRGAAAPRSWAVASAPRGPATSSRAITTTIGTGTRCIVRLIVRCANYFKGTAPGSDYMQNAPAVDRRLHRRRVPHPSALGVAKLDRDRRLSELDRSLVAETDEHGGALDNYFARAHSIVLLTANSAAFGHVLAEPGTREQKVRRHSRNLVDVTRQLGYLERLYPGEHRRGVLHRCRRRGVRACGAWPHRAGGGPVDRGGAVAVLRADLRPRLRADAPGQAVHLRRHRRMGRRQRHADPPAGRPQARDRPLRGHGRELPPRDGPQ